VVFWQHVAVDSCSCGFVRQKFLTPLPQRFSCHVSHVFLCSQAGATKMLLCPFVLWCLHLSFPCVSMC
jgi:hypothetical protein